MALRATSLGPKPSLFFVFLWFCFCFFPLLFAFHEKTVFPLKRAFLFIFQCLPLFLRSLFSPPFSTFSFSVSLVLFFLPSFFSFLFCFVLLPCFFLLSFFLLFLCFCFMKRTTSTYQKLKFWLSSILSIFWFSDFFSFNHLFLNIAVFPALSFVFCSTSLFSF